MSSQTPKGPAKTTPKHGKKIENRLYSKYRRGSPKRESSGGINPDDHIAVAAVCQDEVRVFDDVKHGRRLIRVRQFAHYGAAALWATEHDAAERRALRNRQTAVLN